MEGRVFENFQKNQKLFKNRKMPFFPKVSKRVLNVLGNFSKKIFAQCSMESLRKNFSKKSKNQSPKMPKIVPKSVQTCFEHVFRCFLEKIFCPVFHGRSRLRNFSKKSKNFQNSKNAQNRSQKCPNVF